MRTLRDDFAIAALPAVIDAYSIANAKDSARPEIGTEHLPRNVAIIAYKIADALLAARGEKI